MTQLSPTALEGAADQLRRLEQGGKRLNDWSMLPKATKRKWCDKATAAITAYLAQAGKEGWVMVPKEASARIIAAAFPSTDRDVLSGDDLKTGAAAIMILEGPADLGAITGPAVKEAAAMCKDYRTMLAAAQNGGDLPAPPMGK